jgi:fructose/tagatose bisphosphate aldolase
MTDQPAITVRDWTETRAALEAARSDGRAVFLCSPQGASSWLGAGYWAALQQRARAEFPDLDFTLALDCADNAGDVMAAIRAGVALAIFRGDTGTLAKLQEMARQADVEVRPE